MQDTVNQNREHYIGGSDIGTILGISPYKTRWELLQEKAGIKPIEEVDNAYIRYGNAMEGKIRDYINENIVPDNPFVEGKHIEEGEIIGIRCHTDGENKNTILEIKTTSDIDSNLPIYEAQLCFYMMNAGPSPFIPMDNGILAVYVRPEDMDETFDKARLSVFHYTYTQFVDNGLRDKIEEAVDKFIEDLKALKENPFLSEEDLIPMELVEMADQVVVFEQKMAEIKAAEKAIKEQKQKLYEEMMKCDVKKWITLNGTQITRVDGKAPSSNEVEEFNEEKFAEENPELYKQYTEKKTITSKGSSGYVRITLPKGVK